MSHKHLEFDIVIVGSGAGGGTVAKELSSLCAQGYRVALLELGPRFKPEDNTREEFPMAQQYYFNGGGFQTQSQDMTLAFAKGLGGSTQVYTGVTFHLPQSALDKWQVSDLNLDDLSPRMDKYFQENGAHFEQEQNINRNNQLFKKGCESLGWQVDQFAINTRNCAGLSTCNLGCPRSAKQGTAIVQIPYAESHGVEVITHCKVEKILSDSQGKVTLAAKVSEGNNHYLSGEYQISCKKLVLSAGAIHTPALLMASFGKDFHPMIGRYLTCHPALIMAGEHEEDVKGMQGPPKNYFSEQFSSNERFLLESCMYFPFSFARNLVGFGAEVDEFMSRYPYLQMILALVLDEAQAHNRVEIDEQGQALVHYTLDKTLQTAFVKAIQASAKLLFAAGAKRVHAPASADFFIDQSQSSQLEQLISLKHFKLGQVTIASAHLMGGCRMGDSPESGLCNSWGKLYDYDNIYIADGSLFPGCSEVNPYLTIMALADRVAEGIKRDLAQQRES
jgi:choline dehydrogenase-like flavoprotein